MNELGPSRAGCGLVSFKAGDPRELGMDLTLDEDTHGDGHAPTDWISEDCPTHVPTVPYPPAIAPITRNGSAPVATSSGRRVSGGSFEKSSPQA